jgi:hypothetical protein
METPADSNRNYRQEDSASRHYFTSTSFTKDAKRRSGEPTTKYHSLGGACGVVLTCDCCGTNAVVMVGLA